uniref:Uncharacterized protein n=1 Tax=Phasianus colchicus TaxID=9054 RepID=A0A669Q7I3_PHACC
MEPELGGVTSAFGCFSQIVQGGGRRGPACPCPAGPCSGCPACWCPGHITQLGQTEWDRTEPCLCWTLCGPSRCHIPSAHRAFCNPFGIPFLLFLTCLMAASVLQSSGDPLSSIKHYSLWYSVSSSRCSFLPCKWFSLFLLGCCPMAVGAVVVPWGGQPPAGCRGSEAL